MHRQNKRERDQSFIEDNLESSSDDDSIEEESSEQPIKKP